MPACGHRADRVCHLTGTESREICDASPYKPLVKRVGQLFSAVVDHAERFPHVRLWAQPGNILSQVSRDAAAVRIERKDDFPGQVVFIQPGSQRRRKRSAPVWCACKNNGIRMRRTGPRQESRSAAGLYLLFHLLQQFRECHRVRLPRINFAPVAAGHFLNFLRDPMGVARIGVGNDQWQAVFQFFLSAFHQFLPPCLVMVLGRI